MDGGRPAHEGGPDRPRVVVLDTDGNARAIARAALAPAGLLVIPAATGSAALAVLAALREAPAGADGGGRVALVVGELYVPAAGEPRALPADRQWALANGCDAFLARPAPAAALRREVARLLGRARADCHAYPRAPAPRWSTSRWVARPPHAPR